MIAFIGCWSWCLGGLLWSYCTSLSIWRVVTSWLVIVRLSSRRVILSIFGATRVTVFAPVHSLWPFPPTGPPNCQYPAETSDNPTQLSATDPSMTFTSFMPISLTTSGY
jgi:hypothetical protein